MRRVRPGMNFFVIACAGDKKMGLRRVRHGKKKLCAAERRRKVIVWHESELLWGSVPVPKAPKIMLVHFLARCPRWGYVSD